MFDTVLNTSLNCKYPGWSKLYALESVTLNLPGVFLYPFLYLYLTFQLKLEDSIFVLKTNFDLQIFIFETFYGVYKALMFSVHRIHISRLLIQCIKSMTQINDLYEKSRREKLCPCLLASQLYCLVAMVNWRLILLSSPYK